MRIGIKELQQAMNSILEGIKERNGEAFEIEIEEDYYFSVPTDVLYKVNESPSDLTIGSLADNIEIIKKINSGEKHPTSTDLNKMNPILRYIGDNLV